MERERDQRLKMETIEQREESKRHRTERTEYKNRVRFRIRLQSTSKKLK